jgi:hypothetical protein
MGVYDPLRNYLSLQRSAQFVLTFSEIERILGRQLPASADRPQWWANVRAKHGHVQREAWRRAGYKAFLESPSRVRFERAS